MSAEGPPPRPDRSLVSAAIASVVLVVLAVALGLGAARLTAAPPRPSPSTAPSPIAATGAPDSGPLVFTQPLSAGCVAGDAVYVVSDGGGIGRFAFDRWQLIDPIARSLVAAICRGDELLAVGGGGRLVTIDDRAQTIRADSLQPEDLLAISPLADGALAVGRGGTVQRLGGGGWGVYASGIDEDLFGVAAFSPTSAWVVGAGGVSYRLETAGWRPVPTGVTGTLRAVTGSSADDAVAVGDDGVVLVWDRGWRRVADVPAAGYRAVLRLGASVYVAGDRGTLLRLPAGPAARAAAPVELGTSCTLRALFARGEELWVVGSDGGRAGVWRLAGGTVFRWGQCG